MCIVSVGSYISNVRVMCNVVVNPGAVLMDCTYIVCDYTESLKDICEDGVCRFGNNTPVCVGPETGGRNVSIRFSDTYTSLCSRIILPQQNFPSSDDCKVGINSDAKIEHPIRYSTTLGNKSWLTVIGKNASVVSCSMIKNTFVGPHASISSSSVTECTVLSSLEQRSFIESARYCVSTELVVNNALS